MVPAGRQSSKEEWLGLLTKTIPNPVGLIPANADVLAEACLDCRVNAALRDIQRGTLSRNLFLVDNVHLNLIRHSRRHSATVNQPAARWHDLRMAIHNIVFLGATPERLVFPRWTRHLCRCVGRNSVGESAELTGEKIGHGSHWSLRPFANPFAPIAKKTNS